MQSLKTYCAIESGKLKIIHRDRFTKAITELKDGRYVLSLEKSYRKRSNPQNAVIWGYVYPMILDGLTDAGFDGMDIEKVHDLMKLKFLKTQIVNKDGEVLETIKSTTSLTTIEMMQYLSDLQQFGAEYLNIVIPDPGDNFEINFDN
jgi:hypothetical protein